MSRALNRFSYANPSLIEKLSSIGINTTHDIFVVNPLIILSKTDITLTEFEQLRSSLSSRLTPHPKTALAMLRENIHNREKRFLSTGIAAMNRILYGGLLIGSLTDICGLPGSGKTQFCMTMCLQALLQQETTRVMYIDIELKLDLQRLSQLAQFALQRTASSLTVDELLSRIIVSY
jgi:predicted ATP-dependent serine protease